MPDRLLFALLLALATAPGGFAQHVEPLPPAPDCPIPMKEKCIPHLDVQLVPHEKATTVPDWKLREIEVGRVPTGPVLNFREEKRCILELKIEPREVEQQVVCIESKPVTVTDPCTGQCRTVYQPCQVVKTVKVKVYEKIPVQREVIVRVPVLEKGPDAIVKKIQLDQTTAPAIERRYEAVVTPSKISVLVPVPPCPIAPPLPLHE